MKRITGLIIFILLSSLSIYSQPDMQKYMNDTRILQREGKYQEALQRHIWFYEHALDYAPSMLGVRNSFALSDWKNLGRVYPPALDSLRKTRDKKMEKILNSNEPIPLFQDVVSINRELGENAKTVELFQLLILMKPDVAKNCWIYAKEALFDEKRYDMINIYLSSPVQEYSTVKENYERDVKRNKYNKIGGENSKYNDIRFVEKCTQLILLSYYNNDEKSAKRIHGEAISIIENDLLRSALDAELNKQSGATFIDLYRKKSMYDEFAKEAAKMQHQIDSSIIIEKVKLDSILKQQIK